MESEPCVTINIIITDSGITFNVQGLDESLANDLCLVLKGTIEGFIEVYDDRKGTETSVEPVS